MKIRFFEVDGLLGKRARIPISFNTDLNILTGRNGTGKTTALKLLWYIISANITQAISEIEFTKATLTTTHYSLTIFRINSTTCKAEFQEVDRDREFFEDGYSQNEHEDYGFIDARQSLADRLSSFGSSIFFPTFRRIEGGFSVGVKRNRNALEAQRASRELEEAMANLARRLSNGPHLFVSSLSTLDIESMLLRKYAELSEMSNSAQRKVSQEIMDKIRNP